MTNKLTIYILIVLGAALAGFMAFKSFTNQAKIVKANGEYLYESTKTPFESSFGSKDDPTKVVFRKDGKVLTFNIPYKDINWEKSGNKLIANVDKTKSLAYSILKNNNNDPVGIKEEIILNEKPENNTFEFSINLDGLKPKKESGLWHFYTNDGNSLFYIPKPFMEDAGGQRNEDVQINIDDGKLTVTANKDWLNSNDRKYPIKIDPSLELTVLTVQSFPEEGDIWGVEFTTVGKSDLKITPNDQQTIDDMDFVSLTCDGQEKNPQILTDDVIYYRNWECSGIGKIEHKITKKGNHELKFEFGDQVDFAHNASWLGTWGKRIEITVDNTNIDSDLSHFPIPIFLGPEVGQSGDDTTAVFDEVGANWQKIAVTKDDGTTQLYVEKEMWDNTSYTAPTQIEGIDYGFKSSNLSLTINQWGGGANNGEIDISGTILIDSNGDSLTINNLNNGVALREDLGTSVDGYIMWSSESVHTRFSANAPHLDNADHFIGVYHDGSNWYYDNNGSWYTFTPESTDLLIADITYGTSSVTSASLVDSVSKTYATLWASNSNLTVPSASTTTLYIYYDNTQSNNTTYVADVGNRTEVWDSGYKGVWHMAEASGNLVDSTDNNNNSTSSSGSLDYQRAGSLGYAINFTPTEYFIVPDSTDFTVTDYTIDAYVNSDAIPSVDHQYMLGIYDTTSTDGFFLVQTNNGNSAMLNYLGGVYADAKVGSVSTNPQVWSGISDSGTQTLYIDGVAQIDTGSNNGEIDSSSGLVIGARGGFHTVGWEGLIEEVRFSNISRSASWAKTDYYAQSDDLLTFGSETLINIAPNAPTSLQTEGSTNPTNVEITPEFSAIYNDSDVGDIANKYQIQVDDNSDFSSPIWDSGSSGTAMTNCTQGNRCSSIEYAGSNLSENTTYYWRIRFWDDTGDAGAWSGVVDWLGDWENRIEITVDNTNIDTDLTHFPIPIFLSTSAGQSSDDVSAVFDEVGASWQKIAVTKDDGTTQIYVEKEKWDDTGEEAVLWISKSDLTITNATTTTLYLYYDSNKSDNTSYVADIGGRTEVWNSDYAAVYHMGDSSGLTDSTSNNNDSSTTNGSPSYQQDMDGYKGYAVNFNGSTDYFLIPDSTDFTFTAGFTVEALYDPDNASRNETILRKYTYVDDAFNIYRQITPGPVEVFGLAVNNNWAYATKPMSGAEQYIVGRRDESGGGTDIFRDASKTAGSVQAGTIDSANTLGIGATESGGSYFDGRIAEIRISGITRSDAWIKASHYAQTDNLIEFNSPETVPFNTFTIVQAPSSCKIKEIAQNGSNFDITVEWTDNSSNETGFEVDRSADGGAYSNITTTAADAIEYTDINVPTGSDYTYRMRAVISGGYSYWCTTNDFDLETGITQIEGNIKLEGVNIN